MAFSGAGGAAPADIGREAAETLQGTSGRGGGGGAAETEEQRGGSGYGHASERGAGGASCPA